MSMSERQQARVREAAQTQLAEPVLGAAILMPKGKVMSTASFGLVGALVHTAVRTPASGFAPYNLFAVTEPALHVFEAGGMSATKVKSSIGAWSWGSFGATLSGRGLTRTLVLQWSDGSESKLEAHVTKTQKLQLAVLEQIVQRAAAGRGQHPSTI